jgi:pilus assembly protein CpaE
MRRLRGQDGQSSVEFMGTVWWLFLVVLLIWQVSLAAWAHVETSNAARTASRVQARGGDPAKAARNAVPKGLRKGMKVSMRGEKATVRVRIPILFPGVGRDDFRATQAATLPG